LKTSVGGFPRVQLTKCLQVSSIRPSCRTSIYQRRPAALRSQSIPFRDFSIRFPAISEGAHGANIVGAAITDDEASDVEIDAPASSTAKKAGREKRQSSYKEEAPEVDGMLENGDVDELDEDDDEDGEEPEDVYDSQEAAPPANGC
jgi:hypothetical protein